MNNHGIRVQFPLRVQGCLHNSAQTGCETLKVSFAVGSRFFSCSKVAGRRVNRITHSCAEIKHVGRYTSTLCCYFLAWCIIKHCDIFTFTLHIWQIAYLHSVQFGLYLNTLHSSVGVIATNKCNKNLVHVYHELRRINGLDKF